MELSDIHESRIDLNQQSEIVLFFERLKRLKLQIIHDSLLEITKSFIFDARKNPRNLKLIASQIGSLHIPNLIYLAKLLLLFEDYRDTYCGIECVRIIAGKIFDFKLDRYNFSELQKIISTFELLDIDIPEELQNAFNRTLNDVSIQKHTVWPDEQSIVDSILNDSTLHGFSIGQNEFILWFEVDIVIYDTSWKIFAIIESDWTQHSKYKKKISDQKRDALFYRRWITDLIIRVNNRGCTIVTSSS